VLTVALHTSPTWTTTPATPPVLSLSAYAWYSLTVRFARTVDYEQPPCITDDTALSVS
jgi:hypothetical protein